MKREVNVMRINICKQEIDKRKLLEVIRKYEANDDRKADLVMNISTAESLEKMAM